MAKTKVEQLEVNEQPDQIRTYQFTLTGLTPLLIHADDVEQGDRLSEWRKSPDNKGISKAGDDRSPPWTWKTYCYTDGTYMCVPADNLMAALRYAGSQLILKKQKTFKAATQCGLIIQELSCPIQVPDQVVDDGHGGVRVVSWKPVLAKDIEAIKGTFAEHAQQAKELGFKLHMKRAPVGASKHVRVRPRFDAWRLQGTMEVVMPEFTDQIIESLWTIAGNHAGLCDWRPSSPKSPGPFGRFVASLKRTETATV